MGHPTARLAAPSASALLLLFSLSFQLSLFANAASTIGFYDASCPRAETIIQQIVQSRFSSDPTVTAGLLRMFFHDCFVTGCDASLLLDSTPGSRGEKEAGSNQSVRDFDLIDEIKTALEAACPGVVSCADIMAFATRDSIVLAGGPSYPVGGGRLDSLTSRITDANILPAPTFSVEQAGQAFASQGLSLNDMVVLLGAHSVGFAHCGFFSDRVFDFQGSGQPDPTMNPALVSRLSGVCPNPAGGSDPAVALDQGTRDAFDSSFYTQLTQGNGILQIDQELFGDARTSPLVSQFTNQASFFSAFVQSITTLGDLKIKTSPSQGQVRLQCNKVNPINVPTPPTPTTPQPQTPPVEPLPPPTPTPPRVPPPTPKPPAPKPTPPTPKPPTPMPPTPRPMPPAPKPPTPRPMPPTPKPKPPTPRPMPPTPKPRPPIRKPKPRPRPIFVPRPIFRPRPRPRPISRRRRRPILRRRKPLPPPKFHKPPKSPKPQRPLPTRKPNKKPLIKKPTKKPTKKPIKKPTKKPTSKPVGRIRR